MSGRLCLPGRWRSRACGGTVRHRQTGAVKQYRAATGAEDISDLTRQLGCKSSAYHKASARKGKGPIHVPIAFAPTDFCNPTRFLLHHDVE